MVREELPRLAAMLTEQLLAIPDGGKRRVHIPQAEGARIVAGIVEAARHMTREEGTAARIAAMTDCAMVIRTRALSTPPGARSPHICLRAIEVVAIVAVLTDLASAIGVAE